MTSLLKLICFTIAFALIALLSIEKTYALNCDLRKEVERHQRLDNFIDQKFDHYWYYTRPTPNYRARNLGKIVAYLPDKTALLFYATSDEPDVGDLNAVEAVVDKDQQIAEQFGKHVHWLAPPCP
jgi:hypothetical protein